MAWMYNADLWCDDCARKLLEDCEAQGDEDTGDSDDYPQYVSHLSDEADSPQHCAGCGDFMENALTNEGRAYVIDMVREHINNGRGRAEVLVEWADFYDISVSDLIGE